MKQFTESQKRTYLKNGGERCPKCGSDNVNKEPDPENYGGESCSFPCFCWDCNTAWKEHFVLADITRIKNPDTV